MESLLETLQKNSLASFERNTQEKQKLQHERDERLKTAIDEVFETMKTGIHDKLLSASLNGNFGCVIFESTGTETYNDEFKYIYLLKGPLKWNGPKTFFETKGIESLLTKLKQHLHPIHVHLKYDQRSKKHLVIASWKTQKY
jgi:hypothetical protein